MINIKVSSEKLLDLELNTYVYFLEHEFDFTQLKEIANKFYPPLQETVKQRGFTGKAGSFLEVSGVHKDKGVILLLVGIGDLKNPTKNVETYRRSIGQLIRLIERHKYEKVGLQLPEPIKLELSYRRLAQETVSIAYKASYHFNDFITNPERKFNWPINLTLSVPEKEVENTQDGVNAGIAIGNAINNARHWCDMPPSSLTPNIFANQAKELADKYNLKTTIFSENEIIQMGMGGLAGVSRGSVEDCKLVILEYHTDKAAPTIAIVGKGITFDSGGLSLKPPTAMETMKDDMAGAAIVLSTMQVIAQFKPNINVIAFAPMSENLPSGSATKPGDVLTFYNGKTAEILNTDAEGRLILADALSYAVKNYKLDAIIDLATLTGACSQFLGPFYAGLMSQHPELENKIIAASKTSGDRVWPLPMDNDYRAAIISPVADLSNTGLSKYRSGTITAAFFLQNFVDDVPWAHLDIAGVAFDVPDLSYLRGGSTGFGIRLLTDLIMNWQKNN